MIRLIAALIAMVVASCVASKEIYSPQDKERFRDSVFVGCQSGVENGKYKLLIKKDIFEKVCDCYSSNVTDEIFGNTNFQIALARNDGVAVKNIVAQFQNSSATQSHLNSCIDKMIVVYGGREWIFIDKYPKEFIEKIGLTGEARSEFIRSGMEECSDSVNKANISASAKSSIISSCKCTIEFSADNLSVLYLFEIGRHSDFGKVLETDIASRAKKTCG